MAAEARAPKLEEADSAQWTAAVMTKMSEERVGKIEAELEKKVLFSIIVATMSVFQLMLLIACFCKQPV